MDGFLIDAKRENLDRAARLQLFLRMETLQPPDGNLHLCRTLMIQDVLDTPRGEPLSILNSSNAAGDDGIRYFSRLGFHLPQPCSLPTVLVSSCSSMPTALLVQYVPESINDYRVIPGIRALNQSFTSSDRAEICCGCCSN